MLDKLQFAPTFQRFQQDAVALLPQAVASLLVLVLGVALGILIGRVTRKLLMMSGVNQRAARAGIAESLNAVGISSTAALLATIVKWFVIFSSTIVAMYLLDARLASGLAERFLLYLPNLAGGVAILLGGLVVAKFLSRTVLIAAVNRDVASSRMLSDITRVAVITLTVAIALEQAQIGRTTVLVAFSIVFGGVTLAAAIGAGLALRDVMKHWLLEQLNPARRKREEDVFQHW